MPVNETIVQRLDSQIEQLFAGWNIYTTILAIILVTYLFYPLFVTQEPDIHPLILARQASASPVRQPGESATYRSAEVPYGYPLRSGLNVKDPGAPKWASGRDGDLKDIWRQALKGGAVEGQESVTPGRIVSIMGKEDVIEHKLEKLTREINIVGKHLENQGAKRIAISLPNSVELIISFFAAVFYGSTPILIPPRQSHEALVDLLRSTKADILIASAGTISSQDLASGCPSLSQLILIVEKTSRHMDWEEDIQEDATVIAWHKVIKTSYKAATAELPPNPEGFKTTSIISVIHEQGSKSYEVMEYTQKNIVAAVAAQISTLPRNHRMGPSDFVLSLESLTLIYPMTVTLAGLFSGASIALTSVAGIGVEYDSAFQGQSVTPTILVTSAETMLEVHKLKMAAIKGIWPKFQHSQQMGKLALGSMAKANTSLNKRNPRVIYICGGPLSPPLSPTELNDLRLITGARISYALTNPKVAGAIAQTNIFDYRAGVLQSKGSHFGPPTSSVQIKLVDTPLMKISDDVDTDPVGHIVVSGPAVMGGEVNLGIVGRFGDDNTLFLA